MEFDDPTSEHFVHAPTPRFKLRWGPVYGAARDIQAMIPGLERVFEIAIFPVGGVGAINCDKIIRDTAFSAKNDCIVALTRDVERERGWMRGCECHEADCIAAANNGTTFFCANIRKSSRGPELRQRLIEAKACFRNNQASVRLDPARDPTGEIFSGLHRGYSRLHAATVEK